MTVSVTYALANTSNYKINVTKDGTSPLDTSTLLHKEDFPDIELTRPNVGMDLYELQNKHLITVNGYLHLSKIKDNKFIIPHATESMLTSRANSVGLLSFRSLTSALTKYPITETMVTTDGPTPLFERALITLPYDIEGQIILSMGGYPVFENPEYLYRVSSRSLILRLDKLNYVQKLYELSNYRSIFTDLNLTPINTDPVQFNASDLTSDLTIKKFLSLYNSFAVDVPCATLEVTPVYLERSTVPGNFRTEIEPTFPFVAGFGKFGEYRKRKTNDTKWQVYTTDFVYNNYLFSSLPFDEITVYNAHRDLNKQYALNSGYFLKIDMTE